MNKQALRCPFTSILVFALLLTALPALAAADEGPRPRISPRDRAAFEAVVPEQAKGCDVCVFAHKTCSVACFGLVEKGGVGECLTSCDNVAASCTCDGEVNLRSEDLVPREVLAQTKAACHASVSCQPDYPSCASWSAYSNCGDPFCGFGPRCGECTCDEWGFCWCGPGDAWVQPRERFRVCFDALGNSCTEWQTLQSRTCGC